MDYLYIQNFDKLKAQRYLDWLLKDNGYGGKTHNGYLGTMKTFFTAILERYPILSKIICRHFKSSAGPGQKHNVLKKRTAGR